MFAALLVLSGFMLEQEVSRMPRSAVEQLHLTKAVEPTSAIWKFRCSKMPPRMPQNSDCSRTVFDIRVFTAPDISGTVLPLQKAF